MLVFILSSKSNRNGSRNDSKSKKIEGAERDERKGKKRKEKKRKEKKRKEKKRKERGNFGLCHRIANIFQMKKSNKLILMRMYFI